MKICSVRANLFRTDRQTDRQTDKKLITSTSKAAHFTCQKASLRCPFCIFLGSKFCPSLFIILVSEFRLVKSETFPFPVVCNISLPLEVQQLQIWYAAIHIYLVRELYIWHRYNGNSELHIRYGFSYLVDTHFNFKPQFQFLVFFVFVLVL